MGGTTEETDVLGLWLASRQPVRGGRVAVPAEPVAAPAAVPVAERVAEPVAQQVAQPTVDGPTVHGPTVDGPTVDGPTVDPAPQHAAARAHPLAPRPQGGTSRPDVEFAPRNGTHRMTTALLVLATAGWALTGWWAWEGSSPTWAGVAAIIGLLAVGLWFLRAASTPPRVRITGGTLHIEEHGQRHTWDLTNPYLRLQVRGRVGRPGWKVLLERPEQPAYVVDAGVVEPREFMVFLRSYRPEL
jgi:hypothetical protein